MASGVGPTHCISKPLNLSTFRVFFWWNKNTLVSTPMNACFKRTWSYSQYRTRRFWTLDRIEFYCIFIALLLRRLADYNGESDNAFCIFDLSELKGSFNNRDTALKLTFISYWLHRIFIAFWFVSLTLYGSLPGFGPMETAELFPWIATRGSRGKINTAMQTW